MSMVDSAVAAEPFVISRLVVNIEARVESSGGFDI